MLQRNLKYLLQVLAILLLTVVSVAVQAQDKIDVDTEKVESWFEKNWIWVAAAVVLLIIIALFSSRGNRSSKKVNQRKTTTVVKDPDGNVKSITTTEDTV